MVMTMQGGEMLKLIGYTHILDPRNSMDEKHPTYILVSTRTPSDKIIVAQEGDTFEQIGVIGFRDPDNRYSIQSHKTFIQVSNECLTESEELPFGTGAMFLDAMKRYMDACRKL